MSACDEHPERTALVREYNDVLRIIDAPPLVPNAITALHAARALIAGTPLWDESLHPRRGAEGWAWATTARMQLSLALSLHATARAHAEVLTFGLPQ